MIIGQTVAADISFFLPEKASIPTGRTIPSSDELRTEQRTPSPDPGAAYQQESWIMKWNGAFGVLGLGACSMNGIKYSDVSDTNTHGAW
jgi:hypothetical protein